MSGHFQLKDSDLKFRVVYSLKYCGFLLFKMWFEDQPSVSLMKLLEM